MGQDIWPDRIFGIGPLGNDPEALFGMMDNGHCFVGHGSDRPVLTQEVQSIIGVESALDVERQVQIQ